MRMLAIPDQEHAVAVESGGYFFMPAIRKMRELKMLDRPSTEWTDAQWAELKDTYTTCTQSLQDLLQTADATGRVAVFKEHTPFIASPTVQASFVQQTESPDQPWRVNLAENYCVSNVSPELDLPYNETVIPAEFLLNCVSAFLIRHPALAFPSYYRVMQTFQGKDGNMDDVESALKEALTLRWSRNLYDWFLAASRESSLIGTSSPRRVPIILDADDLLTNPELSLHFCELAGLDPSKVRFEWDPMANEQLEKEDPIRRRTRSTLFASSGISPGKTFHGLTIEGEIIKWTAEFGECASSKLERWVRMAMPDYEYLAGRRLRLPRATDV